MAWLLNCFNSVGGLILLVLMILAVMVPIAYMVTYVCCQEQHIDLKQVQKSRQEKAIQMRGDVLKEYLENNPKNKKVVNQNLTANALTDTSMIR